MLLDALCQIALCCYLRIYRTGAPSEVSLRMQEFMFLAALCSVFVDISTVPELLATILIIDSFSREQKIKIVQEDCKSLIIISILAGSGSLAYVYAIFPLFVVLSGAGLRAIAIAQQSIQLYNASDQPHYMQSYLFTYVWVSIIIQLWHCASHCSDDWWHCYPGNVEEGYANATAALHLAIWIGALLLRGAKRVDNNSHQVDFYEGNLPYKAVRSIIAKINDTIHEEDGEGNEREEAPLSFSTALYALEVGPISDEKLKFSKWFWLLRLVVVLSWGAWLLVFTAYIIFAWLQGRLMVLTFAIPVALTIMANLCFICKAKRTPDESSSSNKEDEDDDIETSKTTSGITVFWLQDSLDKDREQREEAKAKSRRMDAVFQGVIILLAFFVLVTVYTRGAEASFWSTPVSVTRKAGGGLVSIDDP